MSGLGIDRKIQLAQSHCDICKIGTLFGSKLELGRPRVFYLLSAGDFPSLQTLLRHAALIHMDNKRVNATEILCGGCSGKTVFERPELYFGVHVEFYMLL